MSDRFRAPPTSWRRTCSRRHRTSQPFCGEAPILAAKGKLGAGPAGVPSLQDLPEESRVWWRFSAVMRDLPGVVQGCGSGREPCVDAAGLWNEEGAAAIGEAGSERGDG